MAVITDNYKYVVIGGGFFGTYLAQMLKKRDKNGEMVIIEREAELMRRASYNNQARIHGGYHYPRSLLTALRSRANIRRFVKDFQGCVDDDFEQYYAISKSQSKVTASQFKTFCRRIGAPLDEAPNEIKELFNKNLVEAVFRVEEYAFDADKLKDIMSQKLKKERVPVLFNTEAQKIIPSAANESPLRIMLASGGEEFSVSAEYVFICTYSNINTILLNSSIIPLPLKQEMTEIAIVKVPKIFENRGITLMCGPFFSFMPFPPRGLHTLTHVRYTPHHFWQDEKEKIDNQNYYERAKKSMSSNFLKMAKDASRYVPLAAEFKYIDSLWEIKTVLPRNEYDDGRPILFRKNVGGIKNLICILGGKIDNIYDLDNELKAVV